VVLGLRITGGHDPLTKALHGLSARGQRRLTGSYTRSSSTASVDAARKEAPKVDPGAAEQAGRRIVTPSRREHEARPAVGEIEIPAALPFVEVPVRQDPAFGEHPVDRKHVRSRPVRMPVDDPAHASRGERCFDGLRRHVHDVHRLDRLFRLTLKAEAARDCDPLGERLREEVPLKRRGSDHCAELLVRQVARAPGVAVRQQRRGARNLDHDRIREQLASGRSGKVLPKQGIAVAVHQQQPLATRSCRCERGDDDPRVRQSVVANPELEEIAEDHELAMARRILAHEAQEALDRSRPRGVEVQIGNEDRIRQRRRAGAHREHRRRIGEVH
jgi:hypothetical protein